jgi:hypothetical protein
MASIAACSRGMILTLNGTPAHPHYAVAYVLPAHPNDIAARLAGLQEKLISEPSARSERVLGFKLSAFSRLPWVMAGGFHLGHRQTGERIDLDLVER